MRHNLSVIALLGSLGLGQLFGAPEKGSGRENNEVLKKLANLPLGFEVNRGQTEASFGFVGTSRSANIYLKPTGAMLVLPGPAGRNVTPLTLTFTGSNPNAAGQVEEQIPGFTNSYFIGKDPSKWVQGLSKYAKVRYENVWPGIGVVYYGNKQQLEYDFIVAAGKSPSRIRFHVSGAQSMALNAQGDLELKTASGLVTQRIPDIYQDVDGKRHKVAGHYVLAGQDVSFAIASYDHSRPLVIDPVLIYSVPSLANSAAGYGIAIDSFLSAYAVGATVPLQQSNSTFRTTAFLYKVFNSGAVQGFSFGGITGDTIGKAVAVDGSGNVYMTGTTSASDLLSAGFQPTLGDPSGSGSTDAFVVKFTPVSPSNGLSSVLYSSYLGGLGNDSGNAIAVDSTGKIYVAGTTSAANFPKSPNPPATPTYRATGSTAFVTKIDPSFPTAGDQRSLVYSTLVGGTGTDTATSIAVDGSANVYVGGTTTSPSSTFLPIAGNGFSPTKTTSTNDGFLIRLFANSTSANYLTFFTNAPINGITLGADGFIYATGQTSGGLPTNSVFSGYQVSPQGGLDAFLAKFDTNANGVASLLYSSYLGGSADDIGYAVGVDQNGDATVMGTTSSPNFPVTNGGFLAMPSALPDGFVTRIYTNVSGASGAVVFSATVGGSSSDEIRGGVVDRINNVYMTGITSSANFPATTGPLGASVPAAFASKLQVICASKAGVFRNGFFWVVDANGNTAFDGTAHGQDNAFPFGGVSGDIPVWGDWNGDGTTKAGVYRPALGEWLLDFTGDHSYSRIYFFGGIAGDLPVVGDWNGSGTSKIGIFRQGFEWILDFNGNGTFDGADKVYQYGGQAGDVPVVGDWTGSGTSKIGIFRQGFFWILDSNGDGIFEQGIDATFPFGGISGDIPVVGDWNGTGFTKVGVFRLGFFWVLDANGNRLFDQGVDFAFAFGGISGDKPITGCWQQP